MRIAVTSHAGADQIGHCSRRFSVYWLWLPCIAAGLTMLLLWLPEGVAEPLQTVLAWTVIGSVAVIALMAIAKGLDLLLDCETS